MCRRCTASTGKADQPLIADERGPPAGWATLIGRRKAYLQRMGEAGSQRDREPAGRDDGELIEFGGLGDRWPFQRIHLPRMPRIPYLPPAMRFGASRASVTFALAALAVGLLAGFFGGRLTAHKAGHKTMAYATVITPMVVPIGDTIAMTGGRCAVQAGHNLELGLEIRNETGGPVTLRAIRPMFPLGGLRTISSGFGPCGALPATQLPPAASAVLACGGTTPRTPRACGLSVAPGATDWIHATVAVTGGCPEALPVWFKVGYSSARDSGVAALPGFPDLGPVSYRHCRGTQNFSSIVIATVNPGSRHSSRR